MRAAGRRQGFWFKARIIGIRKYAASRPAAAVSPESLWLAVSEPVRQHRSVVMVKAVYCRWGLAMLACFLLVKKPGNRFCVCVRERCRETHGKKLVSVAQQQQCGGDAWSGYSSAIFGSMTPTAPAQAAYITISIP